jgi:hypothetical protein
MDGYSKTRRALQGTTIIRKAYGPTWTTWRQAKPDRGEMAGSFVSVAVNV